VKKKLSAVFCALLALAMLAGLTVPFAAAANVSLEIINPKAKLEPIDNMPLADRAPLAAKLAANGGQGVKILLLFYEKASNSEALIALAQLLKAEYPNIELDAIQNNHATWQADGTAPPLGTPWGPKTGAGYTDGHPYTEQPNDRYIYWATHYDAIIFGVADCNVCTWWSSFHSKMIESQGTPCVVVTNQSYENTQFYGAQDNGFTSCRRVVMDASYFARSYMYSPSGSYFNVANVAGHPYVSDNPAVLTRDQVVTAASTACVNFMKSVFVNPPVSRDLLSRQPGTDNYMHNENYVQAKLSSYDQLKWALTAPLTASESNPAPVTPQEMGDLGVATLTYTGADFGEAVQKFNKDAMEQHFGDGLPLVPPTRDVVDEMLGGTTRAPGEVLGKLKMRGGVITVEKVAVNAVMAGAKPEQFPVILATMEAWANGWEEDKCYWHPMTTGSTGQSIMIMVSGPIAKEIGMETAMGYNGAGNPVNNSIGRAVRLCFRNIGHNLSPDIDTSWRYGRPNDFTLNVFAENLDALPATWVSHSEMMGFPAGTSTVTFMSFASARNFTPNYGEPAAWTLNNLRGLGSSGSNVRIIGYSPAQAAYLAENGETKQTLETYWEGASSVVPGVGNPNNVATTARKAWPVVLGEDPEGAYQFDGSYYQATNYQMQLISGATKTTAGRGATAPSTPRNYNVAVNTVARTATLTWDAPSSDGGSPILKYQVYNYDGGQQTLIDWINVPGGASARSYTFTGLEPGVQYFFRVRAVNGVDNARFFLNTGTDTHVILMGANMRYYQAPVSGDNGVAGHGAWACWPSVTMTGRIRPPFIGSENSVVFPLGTLSALGDSDGGDADSVEDESDIGGEDTELSEAPIEDIGLGEASEA
jgi:hypothetical protein